ncbi:MAG TPA: ubiquitin-like domain-containing protein [Gemmatimonadaceae bacterium]|nr:ubiquitin-like domain-containing protein [Gemmatimonadaceae bacterium]
MSTRFVRSLRTRGDAMKLGTGSAEVLSLRVQVLEAWDAIRVDADPSQTVGDLKRLALSELRSGTHDADDYVVKLHGFEMLDENAPLSSTGARNGSIFLVSDRRRRPVQ